MKIFILLVFFFLTLHVELIAEEDLTRPVPLVLRHLLPGKNDRPDAALGSIFLLGWNGDGLLAVLERIPQGKNYRVYLLVWDTVDDREILKKEYEDWGVRWEEWWDFQKDDLGKKIKEYHIEFSDYQLGAFPLILDNEYYSIVLRKRTFPGNSSLIKQIQVSIHSTDRGEKNVCTLDGIWQGAWVLGFIPSTLENRVVLILLVQPTGWEEGRQPFQFLFTGINLKAGFHHP